LNIYDAITPWKTSTEEVKYFFTEILAGEKHQILIHVIYYSFTFSFLS